MNRGILLLATVLLGGCWWRDVPEPPPPYNPCLPEPEPNPDPVPDPPEVPEEDE